jgi:hypothetical protein
MNSQPTIAQPRWNRLFAPALILLAAAVAVAPQLLRGPSCGHDFDFHLASWFDCTSSWRHGLLYPHWTPSANFGAGEPRFVFYPPLTWMLGATLGLLLPWQFVPLAICFLLLAATGLATRALARLVLDSAPATLAGCAALFSGYALFTAYERSAFAEFAGGFWIPLVLLYILRERNPNAALWQRALDGSTAPLALTVAGCWLSNPTVGVMACYMLAAVALTLAVTSRSCAPLLRAAIGSLLGMGLVAAYLVPATWEQRWVDILQVTRDPGQTLENNWLFAVHAAPSLADHDFVLRQASILAVGMIAVALAGLLVTWLRGRLPADRRLWLPLALIPIAVLLLQFPLSRPVWNLPELRFLQFPWRWLLVLEAPMAIFFASAVWPANSAQRWRRIAVGCACITIFLAMTACADNFFFQPCDDQDSVPGMLDAYRSGHGFIGTDEYEPIDSDNSLIPSGLPAACLVAAPSTQLGVLPSDADPDNPIRLWNADQNSCLATLNWQHDLPEHKRLHAVAPHSGFLVLRLLSFPAWQIKLNGQPVIELPHRDDGLIAVPVHQGPVDLAVDWTTTPDILAGRWLSALVVLLLAVLCLLERKLRRSRLS